MAAGERFAAEFELGRCSGSAPGRGDGARARHPRADGRRHRGRVGRRVPPAGARRGADQSPARSPGRRHFDLAHELFHILTWDTMPPEHVEDASEQSKNRVEQLANSFASALLMPAAVARPLRRRGTERPRRSRSTRRPTRLQVTATALKWRLVALGRLDRAQARQIPDAALRNNGRAAGAGEPPPPLFSQAVRGGDRARDRRRARVAARRAADLLDLTLEDLADLCATHGVKPRSICEAPWRVTRARSWSTPT